MDLSQHQKQEAIELVQDSSWRFLFQCNKWNKTNDKMQKWIRKVINNWLNLSLFAAIAFQVLQALLPQGRDIPTRKIDIEQTGCCRIMHQAEVI